MCSSDLEEAASDASAADTDDTTASPYLDGTYEGEAEGFGGIITVQVTVENGQMTDLSILSADGEDSAYLSNAKDIIPKVLEAQSAEDVYKRQVQHRGTPVIRQSIRQAARIPAWGHGWSRALEQ